MMKIYFRQILKAIKMALATLMLVFVTMGAVQADAVLDDAKRSGVIGEQSDGYLGFVKASPDADLMRRVNEVNAKRRAVYTDLAQKQGQSVNIIASLTAEKLISRAQSGEYYRDAAGKWMRR